MAFLVWFMAGCMVLILLASIFKPDMLKYMSRNDRIVKATSNARDNVRITNSVTNTVYSPLERVPLGDGRSSYTLRSIAPPYHDLKFEASERDFKQSPNGVFDGGVSRMRIAIDDAGKAIGDVVVSGIGFVEDDPMLNQTERAALLERTERKLVDVEGDLEEQQANERRNVEDTVDYVQRLTSARTQPKPRS